MEFFNRSNCRAYVLGNIINPNDIYIVDNFEEKIILHIRNKITNVEIINLLNLVFTPINTSVEIEDSTSFKCEQYIEYFFKSTTSNNDVSITYNDNIFKVKEFINKYEMYSFGMDDIILLHEDIEYREQLTKE